MTGVALVCVLALAAGLAWRRRCLMLVAQASHELRGPLQSAQLGLHGLGGPGDRARVAAIDLELRRAALALEDLSAAVRGRRPSRPSGEVELGALLAEAAAAWEGLALARGATLVLEPPAAPAVVRVDPLRLAQACANLVSNAIEHGGGPVHVRARTVSGGCARIEVTDGGPGLPAPISDLLAAARGRRDRRGHGLAIAAGIAARSGGRLTTAPSPRGARLVLELPIADARPAARRRGIAATARGPWWRETPALRRSAGRSHRARLLRWRSPGRVLPFRRSVEAAAPARRAR